MWTAASFHNRSHLIREVIFDLDGTLLDSLPGVEWSVAQAFAACGLPPMRDTLRPFLGPPIRAIMQHVAPVASDAELDRVERAFRASYDSEGWRMTLCYEGAIGVLRQLLNYGVRLWVATNKNCLPTGKILRELRLDSFFEKVVCRDSRTPPFSSKGEMLAFLVGTHNLCVRECVMVGDTKEDWDAAVYAGVTGILMEHGYGAGLKRHMSAGCLLAPDWNNLLEILAAAEKSTAERLKNEHDRSRYF
jgi:phosphoglycolate phosphatase